MRSDIERKKKNNNNNTNNLREEFRKLLRFTNIWNYTIPPEK